MHDESNTHTDFPTEGADASSAPQLPQLTIVAHAHPKCVGQRHVLRDAETIVLGRGAPHFGAGAFEDHRVSRTHLEVRRNSDVVVARDAGSHNGSFVNGQRIDSKQLEFGDIIAVGRIMLLYHLGPVFHEPPSHPQLLGISAAIGRVVRQIERLAPRELTVLIQGETGVGKELVARALHDESGRAGNFVTIDCSALADGVVHSELFGHAKGAFSGAGGARAGLVQTAGAGTLFLDEVGDASPTLQASLLRLLESGQYRQVGSDRPMHSAARVVAATHVPLQGAVETQRFRQDLFGRLDRFVIRVPPLRERPEDILVLAHTFLERLGAQEVIISRPLAIAMLRYHWPQNVRELAAVVEHALVDSPSGGPLQLSDAVAARLAPQQASAPVSAEPAPKVARPSADDLRARLAAAGGNIKALATELGVARTTLYRWLRAANIDVDQSRR